MDIMRWVDIVLVGFPEISLAIIFALVLIQGNIFKQINRQNMFQFVIRLLISYIIIQTTIYISRMFLHSLVLITVVSTLSYILTLNQILKNNLRKSILGGSLTIFLLLALDVIIVFPLFDILKTTGMAQNTFFNHRILLSILVRLIQFVVIIIVINYPILINSNLLNKDWNELSQQNKITITILLSLVFMCNTFNMNYEDIYVKLQLNSIETSFLFLNLQLYFLGTLILMLIVLIIINRTIDYDSYKTLFQRTPSKIVKEILSVSNQTEIYNCAKELLLFLHINTIDRLTSFLYNLKEQHSKFSFNINENVTDYDYSSLINFLEHILQYDVVNNVSSYLNIEANQDNIYIKFIIGCNEIEYKRLNNYLKQDNIYKNIKYDFLMNDTNIDIKYHDNMIFNIIIRKGGEI